MKKLLLLGVLLVLHITSNVFAVELTPETFFQADIEARQVTIEGMYDRLDLLSSGTATMQEEMQLNEATEQQVSAVFAKYGTTQNDHLVYAQKNTEALAQFLEINPDYQAAYDSLNDQFEAASDSINALLGR